MSDETSVDLRMAEWSVYDGKEVRTETSDSKYNWTGLKMKPGQKVRWVFEAVPAGSDGKYALPSTADYYIQYMATIKFELNGGTMWDQTGTVTREYAAGEVITMPKPSRKGYTFRYWKGSKYEAGARYEVTEDHSFEAVWKKNVTGGSSGSGADTGDHTDVALWTVLLAASLSAMLLMALIRLRRRRA